MNPSLHPLPDPTGAGNGLPSLCSQDFLASAANLRPTIPPRWMKQGLLLAGLATLLCTTGVLISPMDEYVNAPGEVRPRDFTVVFSRCEGILASVLVTDGETVKKGQILATLDPWEMSKTIAQIEGEIEQATAELELAHASSRKIQAAPVPPEFLFSGLEVERQEEVQLIQQDYLSRLRDLQKSGAASGTEILNVRLQLLASETLLKRSQQANQLFRGPYGEAAREETTIKEKVAEARLRRLEKSLAAAREDLNRLEIAAPISGMIIATVSRFPGEKVQAGEPLFKINSSPSTELRLYATEDRVNLIKPGQLVRFRANNNPDRLAPLAVGEVTEVALDRKLEPDEYNLGTPPPYRIQVAVKNTPYQLAVGATVQAEIVIARRPFWRLLAMKAAGDG